MKIGKHSYFQGSVYDWTGRYELIIGNFVSIAEGVKFFLEDGCHNTKYITTFPFTSFEFRKYWNNNEDRSDQYTSKGNIVIGSDVWICAGATILSGVSIGDGAIIGSDSLVTKDIKPYAIVGGNPASLIKYRYSPAIISKLLFIKWWAWTDEKIKRYVPLLTSDKIDDFIRAAEKEG
jgi:chloramphenicol O-acetyltransferase type B